MFDVQAHRGGAGLAPENTLPAFANALDLGVSTLECDVHISADGVAMVTHDRLLSADRVQGPHVGRLVSQLTRAQLADLDCGGAPMPELSALLDLVVRRGADEVGLNIETKFDVIHPEESAPRERFVEVLVATVADAGLAERVSVQCFDWRVLHLVREVEPRHPLNALVSARQLEAYQAGSSPWLDGLDIDDFDSLLPEAVATAGLDAISPSQDLASPALVRGAHEAGLRVLPWTVDDPADMRRLVALGVDGMITNRPDLLREVLAATDEPLPRAYPARD